MSKTKRISAAALALLFVVAAARPAPAAEPVDLIPADSMLVWYGRPLPDAPPPDQPAGPLQSALTLINLARPTLKPADRLRLSVVEGLIQMIRHRHALALIDTAARAADDNPQGKQLHDLKLAVVIEAKQFHGRFYRIIKDSLNDLVNEELGELDTKTVHGLSYWELKDSRLPDWAIVAWGKIGDSVVVTVGEGVWPRIANVAAGREPSIGSDVWNREARTAHEQSALIEIFVRADEMRTRLDPLLDGKVSEFFAVWGAADMHRAHWALGLREDVLFCIAQFVLGEQTVPRVYASPEVADPAIRALIPPDTRFAVYRYSAGEFLERFFTGLWVWQPEENQRMLVRRWEAIQRQNGFNVERDLLPKLGDRIILHNFPKHPWRLPIFFTTMIEIRDDRAAVRETLDKLCAAWEAAMQREAEQRGVVQPVQLQRSPDGNGWHFALGNLTGVAWTLTDRHLIISYSLEALKEYRQWAGEKLGAD